MKTTKDLENLGKEILKDPNEYEKLYSKCGTIEFRNTLGLNAKRGDKISQGKISRSYKIFGVQVRVLKDTKYWKIPTEFTEKTGVPPEVIKEAVAKKGEILTLNYLELLYLLKQVEFGGYFKKGDDPQGAYIKLMLTGYLQEKQALPTVSLNFKSKGDSPKDYIILMDEKNIRGMWQIKPEYEEKFGCLLPNRNLEVLEDAEEIDPNVTTVKGTDALFEELRKANGKH